MTTLSIIVPVLDEALGIVAHLSALQAMRRAGCEVIVVDGGSRDGTMALAAPLADRTIAASRGRAGQMNAGAAAAQGDVLLFLHADTQLPVSADVLLETAMQNARWAWGRFDVSIDTDRALLGVVARCMNLRSRLTGIATGDQAIFVRRQVFADLGGFGDLPLMEDVELSRRLRTRSPPLCMPQRVITSARRWERGGVLRTIVLMWRLRAAYWLGVEPHRLAQKYAANGDGVDDNALRGRTVQRPPGSVR